MWEWDFQSHSVGPAPKEFGEGQALEICEEDGRKMLSLREYDPERRPFLLKGADLPSGAKDWNDIVYRVRYRELERSAFFLAVKSYGRRSEAGYLWYYLHLAHDGIDLRCHELSEEASISPEDERLRSKVTYEAMGKAPPVLGEWTTATLEVGDEVLKVSLEQEDGSVRWGEFKTLPGTGGVLIVSHTPVDIASVTVHQADAPVTASE